MSIHFPLSLCPASLIIFYYVYIHLLIISPITVTSSPGTWKILQPSVGVSAMHMQLLINDRVILFDRTDFGPSNLTLTEGKCRFNSRDLVLTTDCTAHSVEYNIITNTYRPLNILTDTWCSSGTVAADGRLIHTGGFNDGDRAVRIFEPCIEQSSLWCDWKELGNRLLQRRWYASNHLLPNGQVIIIGGIGQFNYEFYPKTEMTDSITELKFLQDTWDEGVENNLYPFVFLNPNDGNSLFIFANNRAIVLDYNTNKVIKTYPTIPGGEPRSYPSTGSAVLLPLHLHDDNTYIEAEVLICGGGKKNSYTEAVSGRFIKALDTCGRIKITDQDPKWVMEKMPMSRVMSDMVLLPNGQVIIINGCESGAAGWELGREAILTPVIYNPEGLKDNRFEVQTPTTIPRVYHSTAILLRDGRIMVGGSNTHAGYEFGDDVLYPTELGLEAFYPGYLNSTRPEIVVPKPSSEFYSYPKMKYGVEFKIQVRIGSGLVDWSGVKVSMIMPPFNTHSFSQGQRMLVLRKVGDGKVVMKMKAVEGDETENVYEVSVKAPGSGSIAPAGYYMLFVVNKDVPSEGVWVKLEE